MTAAPARTVLRGPVVTPLARLPDGVVVVEGEQIRWVGPAGDLPGDLVGRGEVPPRSPHTLLPGLVDLHCHGGGGAGFPDVTDVAQARVAVGEHLAHGTTTLLASLVTADARTMLARAEVLAGLVASGEVAGVHAEGPFLARTRCGAQDPTAMQVGDAGLVRELADRLGRGPGSGRVRRPVGLTSMTLAPEVRGVRGPGGVLEALLEVGAIPSVGHTDASGELVEEVLGHARGRMAADGVRGGLPTVTHLFNAMPPWHHRAPGPVAAALGAAARGDAVVELIADGVHVAPLTVRTVFDLVGPQGVALVSDAIAATGRPDGVHRLGPRGVRVTGGVARLAEAGEDGALAGSTAHLLDVVRTSVEAGVGLVEAVHAAATTPARVLGRPDVGALERGRRADVVVVDADLRVRRVLRAGRWVPTG